MKENMEQEYDLGKGITTKDKGVAIKNFETKLYDLRIDIVEIIKELNKLKKKAKVLENKIRRLK